VPPSARREPRTPFIAAALRAALSAIDERDLAARLNISVITLRRYRDETMSMSWITRQRLSAELARLRPIVDEPKRHRRARVGTTERVASRTVRSRKATA
jgi:hypothetical protein